jgi:hypothetical protein
VILTSYLAISDAQIYFDGRLNTGPWDDADDTTRDKALLQATRAIDRLNFRGEKADESQELQFPRLGDSDIPEDIWCACAEEALSLLDGKDPEMEREALAITEQTFGKIRAKFERDAGRPINILNGIMSATAWGYLLPYLRDPLTVRISRTT